MNPLQGLIEAVIIACIGVAVIFAGGSWIISKIIYDKGYIQSEKLITPEIKLTIKDNKVDTTYIYRK